MMSMPTPPKSLKNWARDVSDNMNNLEYNKGGDYKDQGGEEEEIKQQQSFNIFTKETLNVLENPGLTNELFHQVPR